MGPRVGANEWGRGLGPWALRAQWGHGNLGPALRGGVQLSIRVMYEGRGSVVDSRLSLLRHTLHAVQDPQYVASVKSCDMHVSNKRKRKSRTSQRRSANQFF